MKNLFVSTLILVVSTYLFGQNDAEHVSDNKKIPAVKLTDMKGKAVNTAELGLKGPVVFSFWATWCAPCKRELNTICELYDEWQQETGVTLVAVSIDDQKTILEKIAFASQKGLSGKKQVLIVKGGPGTGKSVVAINALSRLMGQRLNVRYVTPNAAPRAVFEVRLKDSLKLGQIKELFSGSASFTGLQSNDYDLLIFTSKQEGTPNILIEAMAAGIPVIAPAIGGIPDTGINEFSLVEHDNNLSAIVENYKNKIFEYYANCTKKIEI